MSPTIVAFVPYEFKKSNDEGAIEGAAHLRFAVEDTLKCLKPKTVQVLLLYADVLAIKNKSSREHLPVHKFGQAVGAVLVEPGRKGKIIYSVEGPSTLQFLLPQAASEYWNAPECRQ